MSNIEQNLITSSDEKSEISAKDDISTTSSESSLGDYLKAIREKHKYSVKQVSLETKISETIISNLENNNFNSLPKIVYLRGFVKNYCQLFKEPEQKALSILEEKFQQQIKRPDIKGRFSNHEETSSKKLQLLFILILVGVGFFISGYIFFSNKNKKTIIAKKINTKTLSSNTPLHAPTNNEINQELNENTTPTVVTKENTLTSTKKEDENKSINFKPFPNSNYKTHSSHGEDYIAQTFSKAFLAEKSNFSQKIIIKAISGETWLAYKKIESDKIIQKTLRKDEEHLILSDEVSLVLGNSNVVTVFHNDKVLEVSSSNGIRSLVLPRSTARNYRLPLFYFNDNNEFVSSKVELE
ncbi:MAG: hypothetical protein CME61_02475 [Halobacteriovoraceae bacterium]|nr:hypothetical protein [Halobacteriovoraceae bacterium]